jgi:hypothetical protein
MPDNAVPASGTPSPRLHSLMAQPQINCSMRKTARSAPIAMIVRRAGINLRQVFVLEKRSFARCRACASFHALRSGRQRRRAMSARQCISVLVRRSAVLSITLGAGAAPVCRRAQSRPAHGRWSSPSRARRGRPVRRSAAPPDRRLARNGRSASLRFGHIGR